MNKLSKRRLQKLAGLLKEADVVSLTDFRRKKEREKYHNEVVISSDGQIVSMPDEWKYAILTHRDQADALTDGDVKKAVELGAKFYEVGPGDEIDLQDKVSESKLKERMSPEFGQDLIAYFGDIENSPVKKKKRKNRKEAMGTADVVDGPYKEKSKKQPFDDDKHRKDFLKQLNIEALIDNIFNSFKE